jgi:uncharacterized membrane protein
MDIAAVLAVWLHTVAFVIAWGYYGILDRFVLPEVARSLDDDARGPFLRALERRALPFVLLAVVLFTVTGSYMLVTDPRYTGLGDVSSSTWAALIFVKHLVVVGFIVVGVLIDLLIRDLAAATEPEARARIMRRLGFGTLAATALGAVIALLTVVARYAP